MSDLNREAFEAAVAARFVERSDMPPEDAAPHAAYLVAVYLDEEGIEFGDDEYDWSEDGAKTIADDDMSYWETA